MKIYSLSIFLFLLFLVSPDNANGQKLKVKEKSGKVFKLKAPNILDMYQDGNQFWSISRSSGGEYFVARYDKNMNYEDGKKVRFDYHGKYLELTQVVQFKGEFYFFLTFNNQADGKLYLFFTVFDSDGLVTEPELVKVAEMKGQTKKTTAPRYRIVPSEDEQHLLVLGFPAVNLNAKWKWTIFGVYRTINPSKTTSFSMWVLDRQMKIINYQKNHKIQTEESSDKFEFRDFKIADDGTIYILGKNLRIQDYKEDIQDKVKNKKKRSADKDWADYHSSAFILEQISPSGEILQFSTDQEILYSDMSLIMNDQGKLGLMGLIGEVAGGRLVATGVEYTDLNIESLEANDIWSELFSEEVLDKVNDIRVAKNNLSNKGKRKASRRDKRKTREERELDELRARAALNVSDIAFSGYDAEGKPVLILEERWIEVVATTRTDSRGVSTTTYTYYYHYGDLILVKFEEDEVIQKPFNKSYVTTRILKSPLNVITKDEYIYILTASHIIRTEGFMDDFATYNLNEDRKGKTKLDGFFGTYFHFRKAFKDGTIVAAKQRRKKTLWSKIEIN